MPCQIYLFYTQAKRLYTRKHTAYSRERKLSSQDLPAKERATSIQNCIDYVWEFGIFAGGCSSTSHPLKFHETKQYNLVRLLLIGVHHHCHIIWYWHCVPGGNNKTDRALLYIIFRNILFTWIEREIKLKIPFRLNDKWFTWSNDHQ